MFRDFAELSTISDIDFPILREVIVFIYFHWLNYSQECTFTKNVELDLMIILLLK